MMYTPCVSVKMMKTLRIALFMNATRAYEQGLIRGILKYSRLHGPWNIFRIMPVVSGGRNVTVADVRAWRADGIIWREDDNFKELRRLDIPMVVAPYRAIFKEYSNILTNDAAIGKMAAEHFLDRGFRSFAFYGIGQRYWSIDRQQNFSARLAKSGFSTALCTDLPGDTQNRRQSRLADWLISLPKPLALMVCTDDCSHDCLEACKYSGLHIPEDVAIIGVGNDSLICDSSYPPLSSVVIDTEQAGYNAAEQLVRLIHKSKTGVVDIIAEPVHIVTRQSTDILATTDKNLSLAIKYIRDNAGHKTSVEDVVKAIPVSRRLLYQKFRDVLGRSIHEEIRRVQMSYAAKMLVETDLQVAEVAARLGYQDAKNLARVFKQEKQTTPLAYRKKHVK